MDSSLHSILAAQFVKDRMDQATAARATADAKRTGRPDPRPARPKRRFRRSARVQRAS